MKSKLSPDLKCPCCGSDRIHSEDVYDMETAFVEAEYALVEKCVGVCRDCGKHLQWKQVYKFAGFRGVESDE